MGNGSQHPRIELIMRTLSTLVLGILFAAPIVAESIPITTTSPTARAQFLEGRALFEKLRLQEARPTCVCPRYCQYRGESVQGLIPVLWALIISHVLTTKGDESLAHQLARCRFGTLVVQLTKDGDETLDIVVDLRTVAGEDQTIVMLGEALVSCK